MFTAMHHQDVQELHFCHKEQLNAVIAIHNLRLGPALGGCRFLPYDSEQEAITDALRLAKGMSYKAALARVPQGGGKAVIMAPKEPFNRKALFKQFGQFIQSLSGRYITAMDSGTQVTDMDHIRSQTPYVSSSSEIGDPSPTTAQGVALGIATAVQFQFSHDLSNIRVAIQGLGHVGLALAEQLHAQGARLIVSDVDPQKAQLAKQKYQAKVVAPEDIYQQECDVFSPCGLGAILNEKNIDILKCKIIAGCANNQLASDDMGQLIHDKGILYAPDYVINSGGLIFASSRFRGLKTSEIAREVHKLKDTLDKIFVLSHTKNKACHEIANEMAEQILFGKMVQFQEAV